MLVAAFSGWNDAGEAASGAATYLGERWGARPFATLDPEEFFDFSTTRPEIVRTPELGRQVTWPELGFAAAAVREADRDVVLLTGPEPQLRWRTFATEVVSLAQDLEIDLVVTLGALAADVAHTSPVGITGTTGVAELADRLGLAPSTYTGPTGIVGVLGDALAAADVPACSLWAAVPHYVAATRSPKATLALVERAARLVEVPVVAADLAQLAADYEVRVSQLVAEDEDLAAYVERLEAAGSRRQAETAAANPLSEASPEAFAAEVERFLREQRGGPGPQGPPSTP